MLNEIEQYTAIVGENHRKNLGQFFTDSRVAQFMVNWVVAGGTNSLYDPAFGLGSFYSAAKKCGFEGAISGAEIDEKILRFSETIIHSSSCSIDNIDYLSQWGLQHEAVVCNPPYMRFQKFAGRDRVFNEFESKIGIKISGYTNIASAFLIKSIFELAPGGRLAYLMPLEFLNTGYGKLVKKILLEQGTLRAIIKMADEKEIFPEVITSIGIILFEKVKTSIPIHFYTANSIYQLENLFEHQPVSSRAQTDLLPEDKWSKYFEESPQHIETKHLIPISTYGTFTRGIATGANEFFTLTAEQVNSLGLTTNEVIPCITKSNQIKYPIFNHEDFNSLVHKQWPVFLLNLNENLSDLARNYIARGETQGFHQRYLTRVKKPWFKIENRTPSPLLFGVFSRNTFKVIKNCTPVFNLTCYHGFTPNLFGVKYTDHLFLYLLSTTGKYILSQNTRKYGDSLDKFEPNDLNAALCPSMAWFERLSNTDIEQEIIYIRKFNQLSEKIESTFSTLTDLKVHSSQQIT